MKGDNAAKPSFDNTADDKLNFIDAAKKASGYAVADALYNTAKQSAMLNEANATRTANGGPTSLHLLASGPLFGNLSNSTAMVNGAVTNAPTMGFPSVSAADSALPLNGHHLPQQQAQPSSHQTNQVLAMLAAMAARNNSIPQPQPPPTPEALQALFAHAAATSNGLPPFGIYPPPGMRPGLVGPMPTNFLFDSVSNAGYHPYAMEAGRRKNATREVTQPLKVWLEQHHKNPYPTKAEKTVLAIITKMNLTQVSTWFANARRRLKKDNKMTWSPRNNRSAEDEDEDGSERPNSPLSIHSDDTKRDNLDTSSESGNPSGLLNTSSSDSFMYKQDHQRLEHQQQQSQQPQQQQQMDLKKIWRITETIQSDKQKQPTLTDDIKMESKDFSQNDSRALFAALMTQGNTNAADYVALNGANSVSSEPAPSGKMSPSSSGDAPVQEQAKPAFPFPMPLNPATIAALNTLTQQQHHQQQHTNQQQSMMMNPLFTLLSQNQRQMQTHQQQQMLFMVVAAAAAAAAKNPQQQQFMSAQLSQQQQPESYCANSASVSPSCSADLPTADSQQTSAPPRTTATNTRHSYPLRSPAMPSNARPEDESIGENENDRSRSASAGPPSTHPDVSAAAVAFLSHSHVTSTPGGLHSAADA